MNRARIAAAASLAMVGLLALQAPGCAGRSATGETPIAELQPNESRPLFWRIESPSGAVLYLLGSVHVGPAEGWRYPAAVVEAFEQSSRLIVELDSRALGAERGQELVVRYGMVRPPQSLQTMLSDETWALLVSEIEGTQIQLATIMQMQPWLVSQVLVFDAAERIGLTPEMGVDQQFLAHAGDRDVVPLETADFQMALLAGMSDELQEVALLDILGHPEDVDTYLRDLVEAWRLGDEAALLALFFDMLEESPEFQPYFEALLFGRNRSMAKTIDALLEREGSGSGPAFAVVGAGHVVGDRSIGAELARRGYSVERIDVGGRAYLPGSNEGVELAVHR